MSTPKPLCSFRPRGVRSRGHLGGRHVSVAPRRFSTTSTAQDMDPKVTTGPVRPIAKRWVLAGLMLSVTAWPGTARASGHVPDAMLFIILGPPMLLVFVLWSFSWWLLTRRGSPQIWFWGTLFSALSALVCLWFSEITGEYRNLALVGAALPGAMHQLKLLSHYRQRGRKKQVGIA